MRDITACLALLLAALLPAAGASAQVYEDHFSENTLDDYQVTGNTSVQGGTLQLEGPGNVEVYTERTFGNVLELTGRVWISAEHGSYGSVALAVKDTDTGDTYWATLAYGDQLDTRNNMSILHNDRFGALHPITLEDNTWYRVKVRTDMDASERALKMKAWKEGTAEPETWQLKQTLSFGFGPTRVGMRHYGPGTQADDLVVHTSEESTFDWKDELPKPVLADHPDWIDLYWTAWEIAAGNVQHGTEENGFVEAYLDEGFNDHIFQWDTAFMMLFAPYAEGVLPTIQALDNFYRHQHENGAINREILESDGSDFHEQNDPDYTNPPLFAWAELAYYRLTGDSTRFDRVLPILDDYFQWCKRNRTRSSGMYWWSNLASGMDNSPRPQGEVSGWIDYTAQQAMAARQMSRMAEIADRPALEQKYRQEFEELKTLINQRAWDEEAGYYWDVAEDGRFVKNKTAASFWPMLADVASAEQAASLKRHLFNPAEFNRPHLFPTLSYDHPAYEADGAYWRGGVWAPTNVMYIKGLQKTGYEDEARQAAMNHIQNMVTVYENTEPHSIWENYAPEETAPGSPARPSFVGWSGNGPITLLIENVLGIRAHAPDDSVHWQLALTERHGLQDLKFGENEVDLIAEQRTAPGDSARLQINAKEPFTLAVGRADTTYRYDVEAGGQHITVPGAQPTSTGSVSVPPGEARLRQNVPNPFHRHTRLQYYLPEAARTRLVVHDLLGRRMRILKPGRQSAGWHEIEWNGRDQTGRRVSSGLYIGTLLTEGNPRQHVEMIRL